MNMIQLRLKSAQINTYYTEMSNLTFYLSPLYSQRNSPFLMNFFANTPSPLSGVLRATKPLIQLFFSF